MLFELSESPKQSYSELTFNPLIWENLEIKGAIWSKRGVWQSFCVSKQMDQIGRHNSLYILLFPSLMIMQILFHP